ncbi:ATP-binding cassette domain-containing protein [Acetobacterium wieringae]|uniref:Sulfate/thiosulfate import ATP-binding protein CysA n=1 Tax=Acetobacterium wieringae TaxID=52694 RepID=A0A1F2PE86_9FIRM|nr:ATP-binding cassette domain-containing protein [Acetobacterium wieringae]OFV69314.1 sulfate/thiosulfate import ATP-binding protein CysA [Acetobacterium wieringae]
MVNAMVEINNYSVQLGKFKLNQINLNIGEKEIFAVLGRTGSGKTVLLESVAGFYRKFSGKVMIQGIPVIDVPLEKRNIGFVYQDFGLFPHMTVFDNITYGLKIRKMDKGVQKERVDKMAEILSIGHILKQYPGTLSGGERQRTALARALILNPQLLLMDEPFSSLDPATKENMYEQINKIHDIFGCTILFVTHDFNEAQRMADRIGIMVNGELKAVRKSTDLFEWCQDEEINQFLGRNYEGSVHE